jgi:hypothetical protein
MTESKAKALADASMYRHLRDLAADRDYENVPRISLVSALSMLDEARAERDALLAGRERLEKWLVGGSDGGREIHARRAQGGAERWQVRLCECGLAVGYGTDATMDAAITAALDAAEADRG